MALPKTNLLAMPMVHLEIDTGNNEDWLDSIKYVVTGTDPERQLDLRGIDFEMEVRRSPDDNEVVLRASTSDHKLHIGVPPDFGFLIFEVPVDEMKYLHADSYVADIVGREGDEYVRVCVTIVLNIIEGVTR
jgi:hypothetical protein